LSDPVFRYLDDMDIQLWNNLDDPSAMPSVKKGFHAFMRDRFELHQYSVWGIRQLPGMILERLVLRPSQSDENQQPQHQSG